MYFNRWVPHVYVLNASFGFQELITEGTDSLTRSLNLIFVNFVSLLRSIREWPTLNVKRSGRGDRAPSEAPIR